MHEYVVSGTSTYNLLQNYRYSYDAKGRLSSLEIEHNIGTATKGYGVVPQYDGLGRLKSKETKITGNTGNTLVSNTGTYTYTTSSTGQSTQVSQYAYKINGTTANTFNYTYDANGNITAIKNAAGTVVFRYTYDTLGRLTREDNKDANKTYVYTYDNAGNITSKKTYAFTTGTLGTVQSTNTYTYGNTNWKDQLTKFNGTALTYDAIGNPLTYNNGTGMTFTWKNGRRLATAVKGANSVTYGYDDTGLRISKTVNGVEHKYYYDGNLLIYEEYGDDMLIYIYDENGSPIGVKHRNKNFAAEQLETYLFGKNLQGDIIEIYNTSGTAVVKYVYDAWGNIISTSGTQATGIGAKNSLRYRGYYYDTETGFYYISSRYYDPEIGRWINADSIVAGVGGNVKGYNLFAYCFNNPVNMDDQTGNWPKWIKDTVKWVAKNIVRPIVKSAQKTFSEVDLTYSTGVNVSATPSAWIFNGQIGVSIDTKGNVAIQASVGGGITGGDPGISITRYQSVTNAPNIDKLNGAYYQVGGSMAVPVEGIPVAVGGDVMFMPDAELNTEYFGLTGNVGFGTPGMEFHVEWGTTVTLPRTQFNVYEVARSVYIKIMEW